MNKSKFSERFKELLHYNGTNQSELANKIHVSKQCVSDYKSGKSVPSIETLYEICVQLDVSADYLLGLTDKY